MRQESLQSGETATYIPLGEYLSIHLDYEDMAREVVGLEPELVKDLKANFCIGLDEDCYRVTRFPDNESVVYFDHPAKLYSCLGEWQEKLKLDGWDPVPDDQQLDYLYRRCFYAYLAFGLGLEAPPKTRDEMNAFEDRYLAEDAEVLIKEPGQEKGVVFACKVKPLAEIQSGTVYERRWTVRVQRETNSFNYDYNY